MKASIGVLYPGFVSGSCGEGRAERDLFAVGRPSGGAPPRCTSLVLLCYKLLEPKDLAREAILGIGYECSCFGPGAISGRSPRLGVRGGASAPADGCSVRWHAKALVSSRCGLQPVR